MENIYSIQANIYNHISNKISQNLAKRLEILPLEIETGRFTPIYDDKSLRSTFPSERICKFDDLKRREDEVQFNTFINKQC